ncbi:TetR/AcrR family transcriptional regulator [Pseudonocardia acaciae]|uniref:TetR/AcrR family transcriptional regulator n=1 Tax=Pseudonocardia acaciae TaxID=551276 RepID=UPI00048C51C3|nr:TetR/AcrR family transcriptional regulator [Pseudonocardia acaciae]
MIAPGAGSSPKRDTYRHGHLRRALIEAGVELARAGGPDAVVLREVTRRVGVAPNAAYRHFADRRALLDAVCAVAWSEMALAMEAEMAAVAETDRVSLAKARLGAIATGYVRFAQAEPGMFRTAYSIPADMSGANSPDRVGASGLTPFQILQSRLDELVDVGLLPAERRPGAEFVTWSAAHGLATLLVDGPLRALAPEERDDIGRRLLRMVISGL